MFKESKPNAGSVRAQFGIGQGWVTVTPKVPIAGASLNWKIGAFWEKFGMAGKYDGGPFDTYMFGRTHQLGEALAGKYRTGDLTFELEHGFGAHLEMVPAGIPIGGSQLSLNYSNSSAANTYPPGASSGFTLLNHIHAGVAYKNIVDFHVHYMVAWSQDDREEGTPGSSPSGGSINTVDSSGQPDGSLTVVGAEGRLSGGHVGDVYLAYSHIDAKNVTTVGAAIEVLHSAGAVATMAPTASTRISSTVSATAPARSTPRSSITAIASTSGPSTFASASSECTPQCPARTPRASTC